MSNTKFTLGMYEALEMALETLISDFTDVDKTTDAVRNVLLKTRGAE